MLLKRLTPFLSIFIVIQTLLRASLLVRSFSDVDYSMYEIIQLFARGFWLDLVTASFFMLPVVVYHLLLPAKLHGSRFDRITDQVLRTLFMFALFFDAVSEHIFWSEFTTRFNFIAVDYLIYTQEVIGNIMESYPVAKILLGLAVLAIVCTLMNASKQRLAVKPSPFTTRAVSAAVAVAVCFGLYATSSTTQAQFGDNAEAQEIAANGIYNLMYAYWNNEISYERFYAQEPEDKVQATIDKLLAEPENEKQPGEGNVRLIKGKGPEIHKNVVIVVMESMSAAYMKAFGNTQTLTPNLDLLSKQGLFFTNLYATGNRTVRGLEAVTLSLPPAPGQSLIRRAGNDNLFSLGFIFKDRGYKTQFLYGGYGYFDNMTEFFSKNGFDVIDRTNLQADEIHFANVWGVSDEDIFNRAVREADAAHYEGRPFMQMIMTTSNHRPYTYPDGRIEIPSKAGRSGGVKYADYSIGKFIQNATYKPWFKDTVFVFVADHTAGASGKVELDPKKYHIPMIMYAPGFIQPQRFTAIASQIDLAPILLGQLNFTYYSKFYGEDLLHDDDEVPHAFVSNYQKVAFVRDGSMTVLSPKRGIQHYGWPDASKPVEPSDITKDDAIAYYQSASHWRTAYKRIPTVVK